MTTNDAGYLAGLPQNQVRLVVGGQEYGGWKSVKVEAGIERQARSFDLEVTDRWPGQTTVPRRIRPFDACQVFIGDDLVLTGYVDATPIRYDGRTVTVSVRGRSKTADLVDCSPVDLGKASSSASAGSSNPWSNSVGKVSSSARVVSAAATGVNGWRNAKLETIAAALAVPYGVRVLAEIDTGAPLPEHQVQVGETVFESIDRMMRIRHVLSTDNANGDLVFIDAGSAGKARSALELGANILDGACDLDFKDVFSRYVVKGQRAGTDDDFGEHANEAEGDDDDQAEFEGGTNDTGAPVTESVDDARSKRMRLKVFKQCGHADDGTCADQALYERAHRAAKALETTYTVAGWRQADGSLWVHNQLVRVRDPLIDFDQEMLIAEVHYELDASGLRTQLRVGPVDGYRSKAARAAKGGKVKKGGANTWSDVN